MKKPFASSVHSGRAGLAIPVLLAVLILTAGPVLAASYAGRAIDRDVDVAAPGALSPQRMRLPVRSDLEYEDRQREQEGLPFRFAIPEEVNLTPTNAGAWESLPDDRSLWRLRIECPGAESLNLGFTRFVVPWGARLQVYATDGTGRAMLFDADDVKGHGQLWTPVLLTDDLVVELTVASRDRAAVDLALTTIGLGYRGFPEPGRDKAGTCNVDVICPEGDPWREEINCVATYSKGGSTTCSGAMINNTAQDGRPLFLTAFHCDVSAAVAPSVVVYWNYQSPTCGQQGGGSHDDFQTGSTLRANHFSSDFLLLELDDEPDPTFGVTYAGWDRGTQDPTSAVAIHHPQTDEKSISFENDPCATTSYLSQSIPGDGSHIRIFKWDLGTTEPGSSGSPLFDQNHRLVGQLHGGYASCTRDTSDWYGRLSTSWNAGDTPFTRLRDWLDPGNTGAMRIDLYDPEDPDPDPDPADEANLQITSTSPNPFVDQVTVSFTVQRDAMVHTKVYDLRGRLVADLGSLLSTMGSDVRLWEGVSTAGRPVAAGLYILELTADGVSRKTRVVFLR